MPPRNLTYLLLCSLLVPTAPALANDPPKPADCRELFSRIDYRQNFLVVRDYVFPSSVRAARMKVAVLEKVKVKDIFPGTIEIKTGFDTTKVVPYTDAKVFKNYHQAFDDLMEARVAAGLFPQQELSTWRAWMKEKQAKNKYPGLVNEEILKFMQGDGTLAEFIDIQFANYIYEAKKIPVSSVPVYLKSHYPDFYSRMTSYLSRNRQKVIAFVATVTTPVLGYAGAEQLTEILKAFIAPVIDPGKKLAKDTVKSVSEKGMDEVAKVLVSGPDKYPEKLAALRETQKAFAADDFTKLSRVKLKEKMDEYEARYLTYLPEFHDVMLALEKTFDEKWQAALKDKLPTLPSLRNAYDTKKATLDTLMAFVDNRGTPASPEELDKIAFWSGNLAETEDEIGDALADWELYRLNVGKDKIDPVLDREFSRLYVSYLRSMDPEKLRKKMAVRLEAVVAKLEVWADKAKPNKEAEKPLLPGKTPDVMPTPDLSP